MQRRSLGNDNLVGHETPRTHGLVGSQLRYEAVDKRDGSGHGAADAGSGSDCGIESGRIAIIANVKVYVGAADGSVLGKRPANAENEQSAAHNEQSSTHKEQDSFLHVHLLLDSKIHFKPGTT